MRVLRRFTPTGFRLSVYSAILAAYLAASAASDARGEYGELELRFHESSDENRQVAVRLHVTSPRGRPFRARGIPAWHDHMLVDGSCLLSLVPGAYRFAAERGPEYKDVQGSFEIHPGATDNQSIAMERIVDMSASGWWSGDMLTRRHPNDLIPAMNADDLHVACDFNDDRDSSQTHPSDEGPEISSRFIARSGQLTQTDGGRLALFEYAAKVRLTSKFRTGSSSGAAIVAAKRAGARHVAAVDAAAWDLPMWLASHRLDSVMVLGPTLRRDDVELPRSGWHPHDEQLFPGPKGVGQWSEAIYFDVLNTGIPIPPTAGSGSGMNTNPIGYNRVYAYVPGRFSLDAWWHAIHAGRVIVTNGPLMVPSVNGERPGHVFRAPAGQSIALHPSLTLYTRDQIDYLEFIKDGKIVQSVPLERWLADHGELPPIPFESSGWLIIRAVASNLQTYRAVMTGPYYVQIGDMPAIHRKSCQFFADWAVERARQLTQSDAVDHDAIRYHRAAINYWQQRLEVANHE